MIIINLKGFCDVEMVNNAASRLSGQGFETSCYDGHQLPNERVVTFTNTGRI